MATAMRDEVERELLRHAGALRALARDLVGVGDADDLVQDAAVAALATPPRRVGPLGAWLAAIVRHLASKRRRGERRRQQREARAARPECTGPDLSLDQRDQFRRLTQAVLALPEPYQSTLLLRYVTELSPAAIAARTGDPVRTVKSRLQRGLALLRASLDRDGADWRPALAAAFRCSRSSPAVAAAAGAWCMASTTKTAAAWLAAGALLVGGGWVWLGARGPAGPDEVRATSVVADSSPTVSPDPVNAPDRGLVATPDRGVAHGTVHGRCVDESGRPLAGVIAELDASDTSSPPVYTGGDGVFRLHPTASTTRLRLRHGDRAHLSGSWPSPRAGDAIDLGDIVMLPLVTVSGRVIDTRGRPQAGVHVTVRRDVPSRERADLLRFVGDESHTVTTADGSFAPLALPASGRGGVTVDRVLEGKPYRELALVPGRDLALELRVLSDEDLPLIHGVVADETHTPIAGVHIVTKAATDFGAAESDRDGRFVLRPIRMPRPDTTVSLLAYADGFERTETNPVLPDSRDVRVVLRRLSGLHVRVHAAETGDPVEAYALQLLDGARTARGPGEARHTEPHRARPGGIARCPLVERTGLWVYVDPGPGPLAPACVHVAAGDVAGAEVSVALPPRCQRRLRLRTPEGTAVQATFELLDAFDVPLRLDTEAFRFADWSRLHGPAKVCLLQAGESDPAGEVVLSGPGGNDLALRVRGPGIALQILPGVRLDGADPLDLVVRREATWSGRLQPPDVATQLWRASQTARGKRTPRRTWGLELWRQAPQGTETLLRYADALPTYGEDGQFELAGIPAGTWQVGVYACGRRWHLSEIRVDAGECLHQDLDVGPLRLTELSLRVFVDGQPLAGRNVNVLGLHTADHAGRRMVTQELITLDGDGSAHLSVFGGEFSFHVYTAGAMLHAPPRAVPSGGTCECTVLVQQARLGLQVLDAAGQPARAAALSLGVHGNSLTADADGRVSLSNFAAGTYPLRVLPRRLTDDAHWQGRIASWSPAWIELGTLEIAPGENPERVLRLPVEWSR